MSTTSRDNRKPSHAHDLFDLSADAVRPSNVSARAQHEPQGHLRSRRPARRELSFSRVGLYVIGCAAVGLILRFPMPLFLVLPFAGLGCAIATKSAPLGICARVGLAAGVLAQATSIFVTPFSWWLRFSFFAVLIGAVVAMGAWQIRDV